MTSLHAYRLNNDFQNAIILFMINQFLISLYQQHKT